jgi:hypothetical protein
MLQMGGDEAQDADFFSFLQGGKRNTYLIEKNAGQCISLTLCVQAKFWLRQKAHFTVQ